jgi:hypothetical protein
LIAEALTAVILIVTAQIPANADSRFTHDVRQAGGPWDRHSSFAHDDGHLVCDDLRAGASGATQVSRLIDIDKWYRFGRWTRKESEIIVYWAITDLCPDQTSKRHDQWETGQ